MQKPNWFVGLALACGVLSARAEPAQEPGKGLQPTDKRDLTEEFAVAPGLEVRLWAEAPQLFNPTAMDVDERGRIWVTEAVNYRRWRGRNPGLVHEGGDRVVILEDTDGDGAADVSKVFVQDPDLVAPLGICVLGHSAIVSCSPNAFLYTDDNGDDVADRREVLLTGFGGHDHDHGLHSFVIGPDGRYYFAVGNAGPHIVKDRAGWTLRSGSLYNDGGEFVADNKPGLVSDDGRVWVGGMVLRCERDFTGLTVLAHNFRNNYEVALDSFGNLFQSDNDDDGTQGCRALWVMEGSNNGYFSADGSRFWMADKRPGQSTLAAHWHQDDPGVCPYGTNTGSGGPTGVAIYEGDLFGAAFNGTMLAADAGRNCVFGLKPRADLSGYTLDPGTFLAPRAKPEVDERARWFRPSDVVVGTDGAIYVSDWWDPGVGGHAMGDREAYGRILRIAPKNAPRRAPKIDLESLEGQVAALASPAVQIRGRAAILLRARDRESQSAAARIEGGSNRRLRARAFWIVGGPANAREWFASSRMAGVDAEMAVTSMRRLDQAGALRTWAEAAASEPAEWKGLLKDPTFEPQLERELALRAASQANDASEALWLGLARKCDGADRWMLEALGIAASGREAALFSKLSTEWPKDPLKWSDGQAAIAWRLHPPSAIPSFAARAAAKTLSPDGRRRAVDALAFIRDRAAGEAMLNLALVGPPDVQPLARWWIENRDTNDWREYHLAEQIAGAGKEHAKVLWKSGVLRGGSAPVDVDLKGARTLWLVVSDGGDGNGCDWSNWADAKLSGPGGETWLDSLTWNDASAGWGSVHVNVNCDGGPLQIGERKYEHGVGTHAASEIEYRLPEGRFTRLTATAGLDQHGVLQKCGATVEFQVLAEFPPDPARWTALKRTWLDASASKEARKSAAEALCGTRDGGLLVLESARKGEITPDAKTLVAHAIFSNPDLSVRALASEYFERSGAILPPADELLALHGDPRNGQRVFFGAVANCSTCHTFAGRGGDIGPDLTNLRAKYGAPQILESMLAPSAAIAFGFDTWLIETRDERLFSGFILADGADVLIKDSSGKRTAIAADEIVSRTKQRLSAMPDNVALGLAPREIADVIAFLSEDRSAPPELGERIELFNGRDLTGWTFYLEDPKAQMADVWSVADGVLSCKGQPIGYLRTEGDYTNFELTLEWRFPPGSPPGNSGVLMRMIGKDKVWPKSIEAQLQHRNAGDIWNIDEFPMQVDPARTDGRHTAKLLPCNEVQLGEWNRYRITFDRGNLTLEVNGEVQNRASWCDEVPGKICLQSEGAPIQFRRIVLRPIE